MIINNSGKIQCPHCNGTHVIKHGKDKSGTQRFRCQECKKTFVLSRNTILFSTKLDIVIWEKYIECMMLKLSLKKIAEICGISVRTAFIMRHKILDVLSLMQDDVMMKGNVESNPTFVKRNYKGNHNKDGVNIGRKPRKRGNDFKGAGLNDEQVCIAVAIEPGAHLSVGRISNLGKSKSDDLVRALTPNIENGSLLITDSERAFNRVAEYLNSPHIIIPANRRSCGIYHIQHVNNYHKHLDDFINVTFNGVATKYLNNYIVYNNMTNYADGSIKDKMNIIKNFIFKQYYNVGRDEVSIRPLLPIP